ncbi:hypothetical protein K1719_019485 [Acacia pycnantha]|nr:hypothetical protein K1719_019485 [Acacia pycnantha]
MFSSSLLDVLYGWLKLDLGNERGVTSVLYPTTGGNIHEFTALTPSVVLDVLGPPYSQEDGRNCSYYKDHSYAAFFNGDSEVGEEDKYEYG